MSRVKQGALATGLVAVGYVLGASGLFAPVPLAAQPKPAVEGISEESASKIKAANEAMQAAVVALQADQKYVPATTGFNSFAILSGGVNAVEDLENNRGVDPETFAGLYAGLADDTIKSKLNTDAEGRITYDGKVVRLYPISRLKKLYADRDLLAGLKPKKGM